MRADSGMRLHLLQSIVRSAGMEGRNGEGQFQSGGRVGGRGLLQEFPRHGILPRFQQRLSGVGENRRVRLQGCHGARGGQRLAGLPVFERKFQVVQLRIGIAGIVADCLLHARPIIRALLFRRKTEIPHQVARSLRRAHLTIAPQERFRFRVLSRLAERVGQMKDEGGFVRRQLNRLAQGPDGIIQAVHGAIRLA